MKDFKATRQIHEEPRNYLASHRSSLSVMRGPALGQVFDITRPRMTLGRGDGANIALNDDRASRFHAEIVVGTESVELRDLRSTNGTHVNGQSIQACVLRDGDTITIGDSILRFTTAKVASDSDPAAGRTGGRAGFQAPSSRPTEPEPGPHRRTA